MMSGLRICKIAVSGAMLVIALDSTAADVVQHGDDHAVTVEALADIQSAITEIVKAENASWSGPETYKASARRAIDALEGGDPAARNGAGDRHGAIGRIEHLLDRGDNRPWEPVLDGVLVNLRAAVANLHDAGNARSLDDFGAAASRALEDLEMAQGKANDYGVLGGMLGAVANTELAVPSSAKSLNGCSVPHEAGYGVYRGYLAYRAVSLDKGRAGLIPTSGGERIRVNGDLVVIYTSAAPLVQQQCVMKQ
jgi:polar amino acid transport system substrate-binding protein